MAHEINFDGIVGPTHNYAGLSYGNLASQKSRASASNPKAAALEGLAKMKRLAELGVRQAVLPPHPRPDLAALRRIGFSGTDAQMLEKAAREDPVLLASCYSASAMWTANAATVSPSADTADGRVHFTPANLAGQFHRSLEAPTTAAVLRAIFADPEHFTHHDPLPATVTFGDEGAANWMRLAGLHGAPGVEVFVYGRSALDAGVASPRTYPARQTREASAAVARLHGLDAHRALLVQQNPAAIDAGVFHNDVIAVANESVLMYHDAAFVDAERLTRDLAGRCGDGPERLRLIRVEAESIPLADAVQSYLFNSQLVTLPDDSMALVAPAECLEVPNVRRFLDELPHQGTRIRSVHYVEVRQSMRNGGGPACLRLRVVLTDDEMAAMHPGVLFTDALHAELRAWIERHYRDTLAPADLADPRLMEESRTALEHLMQILQLPPPGIT